MIVRSSKFILSRKKKPCTSSAAIYIFLPLILTIGINSLISVKLIVRERAQEVGCAGCRLGGGHCAAPVSNTCEAIIPPCAVLSTTTTDRPVRAGQRNEGPHTGTPGLRRDYTRAGQI